MRTVVASARDVGELDRIDQAVRKLEAAWRDGRPRLEDHWERGTHADSIALLASLVKADLRCRFARGEAPAVAEYLEQYPALRAQGERVLSLIYEEFCLREERGERPDPEQFCDLYPDWRDSLASQLRYHSMFSQVAMAAPATRFPEPGERFGELEILAPLGQGGVGKVYRARDESIGGREVALKISTDRGHEASILGQLEHPHIIDVRRIVNDPATGLCGLCMPYRPGLPLDKVIERVVAAPRPRTARALWEVVAASGAEGGPGASPGRSGWDGFPIQASFAEAVAWIVATLARALAYAHSRGVFHRDVKPANVLLTLRDGPQLLDFNLSHDPHSSGQAESARRGGTLPYMAPEQLKAFLDPEYWGRVKAGADLYSLGLVMLELLTGRPPETPDATLPLPRAIGSLLDLRADFRPLISARDRSIPRGLEAIVVRCLAFSPEARYPDAPALADDLQRFLERRPLRYASNPSVRERIGNRARRSWRGLTVVAIVLVLASLLFRSAVARIVPLEWRGEFQAAVGDAAQGREQALRSLDKLSEEYPDSPLIPFYRSVVLAWNGKNQAALEHFERALDLPRARTTLVGWGEGHAGVAFEAEMLGRTFFNSRPPLALHAFEIALGVDPTLKMARQAKAALLAFDKRYAEAHALLTELIREVGPRPSVEDRDYLVVWYRMRADVDIAWASRQRDLDLRRLSVAERARFIETIRDLYGDALRDLKSGRMLPRSADREHRDAYDLSTATARIDLGDVESWSGRREEASLHYRDAKQILEGLGTIGKSERRRQDLLRQVDERLRSS